MIRTVSDFIKTLQDCYDADDEIFVVWVARDEIGDVTDAQWKKILKHLDKRSAVASELDFDLENAYATVVVE